MSQPLKDQIGDAIVPAIIASVIAGTWCGLMKMFHADMYDLAGVIAALIITVIIRKDHPK